jgi:hypothetical protein
MALPWTRTRRTGTQRKVLSVMFWLNLIAVSLIVLNSPPVATFCPDGAEHRGYAPPDGNGWECVIQGEGATLLRHGWSVDFWSNGRKKSACEYEQDQLHGRCSAWDDQGNLMSRGEYEAGKRVGYWWFWDSLGALQDPDGAAARQFAEKIMTALGGEADAPALAQHLLEHAFSVQAHIRAAPQVCASALCASSAIVDGRSVLAIQFQPPTVKVAQSTQQLGRLANEAAGAKALIERAQKKRDKARARAEAEYDDRVRRWDNTHLECVDGTRSPSCTCGYSWQGCCSHHGGVAGCPTEYPEAPALDSSPLVPNEYVETP